MNAEAQSCTVGFPTTVSDCTNDGCATRHFSASVVTRIIPDMMFNCTGTVVKWRAAGFYISGPVNAMLDIWRERSGISGTYDKVATIELGTCESGVKATLVTGFSNVYECTLPESLRVSVQPGDVLGIELARNREYNFRLYLDDTNGGPMNYQFNGQFSTVTLSQSDSTSQDQPQISLTVEMAVLTTESSTTTQLPTTSIASTTELTTAADTTPGEGQTTTVVMESTTPLTVEPTDSEATVNEPTASIATTRLGTTSLIGDSGVSAGVIVGAVLGGVVGLALLAAVILLTLTVLHLTRKYKKVVRRGAYGKPRENDLSQNVNTLNMEMTGNTSYVPYLGHHNETFFSIQYESSTATMTVELGNEPEVLEYNRAYITTNSNIPTKDNVAYGETSVNADVDYETIEELASHRPRGFTSTEPNIYSTIS